MKSTLLLFAILSSSIRLNSQVPLLADFFSILVAEEMKARSEYGIMLNFGQPVPSRDQIKARKKILNHQFDSLSRQIAKHETDAGLYYQRGMIKNELGAYNSAKDDFDRAYELGSRTRDLLMNLGIINYVLQRGSISFSYFNKILKKDSTDAEAYFERGQAKMFNTLSAMKSIRAQQEEAIPDFTLAIKYRPDYEDALILRGLAYYHLKAGDAAIADFTRATELPDKRPIAFLLLGQALIKTQQYAKACEVLTGAAQNGIDVPLDLMRQSCDSR